MTYGSVCLSIENWCWVREKQSEASMVDYWVSHERHFCKYCNVWMQGDKLVRVCVALRADRGLRGLVWSRTSAKLSC